MNLDHLERLLRSVEEWNEWRRENPDVVPDLTLAALNGKDLSGANLSGANLRRARLDGVNLSGARLGDVDLSRVRLTGADLTDSYHNTQTLWPTGFIPPPSRADPIPDQSDEEAAEIDETTAAEPTQPAARAIERLTSVAQDTERRALVGEAIEEILTSARSLLDDPPADMPAEELLILESDLFSLTGQQRSPDPHLATVESMADRLFRRVAKYAPGVVSDEAAAAVGGRETAIELMAALAAAAQQSEVGDPDPDVDLIAVNKKLDDLRIAVSAVDGRLEQLHQEVRRASSRLRAWEVGVISSATAAWLMQTGNLGRIAAGFLKVIIAIYRFARV